MTAAVVEAVECGLCGFPAYGVAVHPCCEANRAEIEAGRMRPSCAESRRAEARRKWQEAEKARKERKAAGRVRTEAATPVSTRAAEAARDAALAEVAATYAASTRAALEVIGRWADGGSPFTANETRAEMRAAHVPTPVIGLAFGLAAKQGRIRRLDWVASTDPGTHGKPIARYVAAGRAVQPVAELPAEPRRDDQGRFASADRSSGQTEIFDLLGSTP